MKNYFIIISFLSLFSCSFDNQSGVWNDKINDIELSNINLSDLNNDKNPLKNKRIIITYGKHSKFPDIN